MSKLIVVCGLPGAGKTTFAKALSRKLNIICLHKDLIKDNLYETLKGAAIEDGERIGLYSIKLLFQLAEEQIRNKVDLIVEAVFNYKEDIKYFSELKKKYNLDLYILICKINEKERKKRFITRSRHQSRHRCFNRIWFDYNKMTGKKLEIITNKPIKLLVDKAINWINKN